MIANIYRRKFNASALVETFALYSFDPEAGEKFAAINVPEGWHLVGEGEQVLVKRLDFNVMTSQDASEALMSAIIGAMGFSLHTPPAGGMPMLLHKAATGDESVDAVVLGVSAGGQIVPPASISQALPSPNGKANLPATRKRR
jgi:hypothetical protein